MKFWRKLEFTKRKNYKILKSKRKKYYWVTRARIQPRKEELLQLNITPDYPWMYSIELMPERKQLLVSFKQAEIGRK